MSRIVYAVPGVTPQGSEIADLNQARALARAKNVHLFAYREEDDGSLTMLGSETPKGSIVKFKANPLKEFRGHKSFVNRAVFADADGAFGGVWNFWGWFVFAKMWQYY